MDSDILMNVDTGTSSEKHEFGHDKISDTVVRSSTIPTFVSFCYGGPEVDKSDFTV